jgi:two component regulator with propeller domain
VSGRPQKICRVGRAWLGLDGFPPRYLRLPALIPPAFAQRYSVKYYGQKEGLSNLATECLFQDRAGYLWVGTQMVGSSYLSQAKAGDFIPIA